LLHYIVTKKTSRFLLLYDIVRFVTPRYLEICVRYVFTVHGVVMHAKDALCSMKTIFSILRNNCTKEVLNIVHCTVDRGPKSESINEL